jgi:1-deoxy-D-xylulose 5-phosphate reductoisomerase
MDYEAKYGGSVLPVDSEPSAIWQCLQGEENQVRRLMITASGGPFRELPLAEMSSVTPERALKHPTWTMGQKITIDSATLMNKAFEVIESHCLFKVPWDKIEVVIHPQSTIHSMVEFEDGSVKAQLGPPDMRLPIQYALFYPKRLFNDMIPKLDTGISHSLTFQPMEAERYPCFNLAVAAGQRGGTFPAVLTAADEVAVAAFLQRPDTSSSIFFNELFDYVSEGESQAGTPTGLWAWAHGNGDAYHLKKVVFDESDPEQGWRFVVLFHRHNDYGNAWEDYANASETVIDR